MHSPYGEFYKTRKCNKIIGARRFSKFKKKSDSGLGYNGASVRASDQAMIAQAVTMREMIAAIIAAMIA
jgi:hypothetical protein